MLTLFKGIIKTLTFFSIYGRINWKEIKLKENYNDSKDSTY